MCALVRIRVGERTRNVLRALARERGTSLDGVLEEAVEAVLRARFFAQLRCDYAAARADVEDWAELEAERALWDCVWLGGRDDEASEDEPALEVSRGSVLLPPAPRAP